MANTKNFIAKNGVSTGDGYAMPDIRPSLLLDFANSKTLDPRITFTRGSTATYWDGHTTTKAEENLAKYSQDYSQSDWSKFNLTLTDDATTAPDGTTTAASLITTTANNNHYIAYNYGNLANVQVTQSWYAKANGYNHCFIGHGIGTTEGAWFNLSTGATGTVGGTLTSSSITSVGNGWYRCSITYTVSQTVRYVIIAPTNADGTVFFTGDGTSGIYVWGAQLEQRSSATAYTATTSAPIVKYQPTLQTAASGEARFDHDPVTGESKGLLIEESRTNIAPQSQDWSYWANSSLTRYPNAMLAPDGTQTADVLIPTGTSRHFSYDGAGIGVAGKTWCLSCYVKKIGNPPEFRFGYRVDADNQGGDRYISASTGSNIEDGEDVGNGWYRLYATFTVNTNPTQGLVQLIIGSTNGYSANDWDGYAVWGYQAEEGSFPTSYIPTSGSTVTRSADDASITDMSTISPSGEGTLFADAFSRRPVSAHSSSYIITRLSSDTDNYVDLRYRSSGASGETVTALGSSKISATSVNPAAEVDVKLVVSYSYDSFAAAGNGSSVTTATGTALPELTSMDIGSLSGVNNMSGTIKKIAFYSQRLSNATLQQMTED